MRATRSKRGALNDDANGMCPTLEFDQSSAGCSRSRGLELAPEGASTRAKTEAADDTIVKVFVFDHSVGARGTHPDPSATRACAAQLREVEPATVCHLRPPAPR